MQAGLPHHECLLLRLPGHAAVDAAAAAASQVAKYLVHSCATLYRLGGLRPEWRLWVACVLPQHHVHHVMTGGTKVGDQKHQEPR